jgi:glucosamine--fructose-6-phosphate aminotransferase (isomerizing)
MNAMDGTPSYATFEEILQQPRAWEDALAEVERQRESLSACIAASRPEQVLYIGCGSPFYLARTAASLTRDMAQLPAEAHPASDIWLFPRQTFLAERRALGVFVSRSGETTEILKAVDVLSAASGNAALAITCYESSALAQRVSPTLLTRGGMEQGLAQTRSFTSMLIAAQGLIALLAGQRLSARFAELPDAGRALIDEQHELAKHVGSNPKFERFFFLGGGSYYGIACEATLKMKEMSLSQSEGYHFLEFRHGPMTLVDHQTLVVGFVSEAALPYETAVLREMRAMGAKVLALSPTTLPADAADYPIVLPSGFSDAERTALYLPVLHLLSYYTTLRKGLNPDLPHNLNAVVNLSELPS